MDIFNELSYHPYSTFVQATYKGARSMQNTRNYTPIATIGSLIFIAICLSLIILLNKLTADNNLIIADYHQVSKTDDLLPPKVENSGVEKTPVTEVEKSPISLTDSLSAYTPSDTALHQTITDMVQDQFGDNILDGEDEILAAINENNLNVEDLGYLFLPEHPAKSTADLLATQQDVPLYLQKDVEWRSAKYGNITQQLGENGCAILSLAMVHAFYEGRDVSPMEILDWSHEDYWVDAGGTSWNIFYDFAVEFDYDFYNYGNDFYSAMEAVNNGELVVVSVDPGTFTTVGHILVIRGYADGKVYINDPNDDPKKMFSFQGIDEEILLAEGVNYWSLSK